MSASARTGAPSTLGDGFQLIGVTPDEARPRCSGLRAARPEESFVISLRTGWDPQGMDTDRIRREHAEYEAAGHPARRLRAVADEPRRLAALDGAARRRSSASPAEHGRSGPSRGAGTDR